jgi:hypothetical protein
MKRFLIVSALALGLASCAQLTADYNALTGVTVSPTAVIVAANAFDAVEATATNYLRLPKCTASNGPVCRNPTATAQIIPAIRSGRIARNNLEAFMQANPGAIGPTGLYSALTTATTTLEQIFTTYNIK